MSRSALRMRLLTLALAGCGQPSGYDNDELWGDPTWRSSDFLQISAAWGDDPHVAVSWELIVMKPCCVELAVGCFAGSWMWRAESGCDLSGFCAVGRVAQSAGQMAYIGAVGFGLIAVVNSLPRRREKKRASECGGVFCDEMPFFSG